MSETVQIEMSHGPLSPSSPRIYASSFQLFASDTEVTILMGRSQPTFKDGSMSDPIIEAVGLVSMSPQAAKELVLILSAAVEHHEAANGVLSTAFLRERTGGK